jgi:hypothetical protein
MISDLFSYLVGQVANVQLEGLKSKADSMVDRVFYRLQIEKDKMIQPVMEDFFLKVEVLKKKLLKQLVQIFIFVLGIFFISFGAGSVIDRFTGFPGTVHMLVGAILLFISYVMHESSS